MTSSAKHSRTETRHSWLPATLVLLAAAVFGYVVLPYLSPPRPRHGPELGQPAPDFSLPVIHGGDPGSRISLGALAGNVVVLDFWASWCKPCVVQAGILGEVVPRYENQDVIFVGVNTADHPERAREFARRHALPYAAVLDTGEIASAYGANSLPTVIVVDPAGRISSAESRIMSAEDLGAAIERAR